MITKSAMITIDVVTRKKMSSTNEMSAVEVVLRPNERR